MKEETYVVMYPTSEIILFATDNKKEAEEWAKDYPGSEVIKGG